MSLNLITIILNLAPPIITNTLITIIIVKSQLKKIINTSPNPPNLSNRPAKIIDPVTGASTWALGNQR